MLNKNSNEEKEEISNYVLEKYNWDTVTETTEEILKPKKQDKKNWLYYLVVVCIYGFVFQNFIQTYIPLFKYFDEFMAMISIPIIGYAIIKKDKRILTTDNIIIAICLTIISGIGIYSNLKYKYQPISVVIPDIIVLLKFFVIYFMGRIILKREEVFKYKKQISKHIKIIVLFLFLFTIANYVFDIFEGQIRYGIKTNTLFYQHATYLAAASVFLLANIVLWQDKINFKYILIVILLIATTLRAKSLAFVAIFVLLAFYIMKTNKKISILKLALLGIICVFVAFDQIYYYFVEIEDSARASLLKTSIEIANDYFPVGTGFATYGSHFSIEPYSEIYEKYEIDKIYGLTEGNSNFVSDNFWPMILGQFGYTGLICYAIALILIFKNIQDNYSPENKNEYLAKMTSIVYLLICSTSESAFVNPMAIPFALLLSII